MDMRMNRYVYCVLSCVAPGLYAGPAEQAFPRGAEIYARRCVDCHGAHGEGVQEEYDKPLVGDFALARLTSLIHKTMPDDDPTLCRDKDAKEVAKYINKAFYGPDAVIKRPRPRIEFARLTVRQYEHAVADLLAAFTSRGDTKKRGGLNATYYTKRAKKKVFERVDGEIAFDWKSGTPDNDRFDRDAFSIHWRGSVIAEQTGIYEFSVKSENGFQLWVNAQDEKALIDGYVAAGPDAPARRARIRLLGGRAYPIALEFFKYKDNTASVELRWKPPHKVETRLSKHNLSPESVPASLVLETPFPPDDSSVGYPRGTSVSKAWDEATTFAALEILRGVMKNLDRMAKIAEDDQGRTAKIKGFAERFVEHAFRRPLTPEQRRRYVDIHFESSPDAEHAIKRVVLMALKSPYFLYPELPTGQPDAYTIASRLSFGLWDSQPDEALLRAAGKGHLRTEDEVRRAARRMLQDPRSRAKLADFFYHWLRMDEPGLVAKDRTLFPGFDAVLIADLRTSLERFLEAVVWSDRSDYRELMLANYMYLNKRLVDYYGAKKDVGSDFQKVSFDPKRRSGVITHPYLLSSLSYHQNTSPINRGVFIMRSLLTRSLNPPPEDQTFVDSQFNPRLTMREKITELTQPAKCQACHSLIDPLGFSLEHYDAVGRFRVQEKGKPIQAVSSYQTREGKTIKLRGARDLAEYVSRDASAQRGFLIQLFNQLAKQPIQAYGPDTLKDLHANFRKNGYHIQKLLVEMAVVMALHEREGA